MKSKENLIWCDLEMTGLEPETDKIIEMAFIVTDKDLTPLDDGISFAIYQPDEVLNAMDEWNTTHHTSSGLVQRVKESPIDLEQAQDICIEYLKQFCPAGSCPLCGNSICQDRRFLYKYAPRLSRFFHYRSVDVTSVKELAARWYPAVEAFEKSEKHLALDDIKESLAELQYFKEKIFIK